MNTTLPPEEKRKPAKLARELKIPFAFRWPIKQVGENMIEVIVPEFENGFFPIDPVFALEVRLSEGEMQKAAEAVLRAIAMIE